MRSLTQDELALWVKGGNIGPDPVYFVTIKSKSCVNCEVLMQKKDLFGDMYQYFATYTHNPSETIGAQILAGLNVMSVPVIIFRYKINEGWKDEEWKLHAIKPDMRELMDLQCVFDAINDEDYRYFGFGPYNDPVDSDAQEEFNQLLRLIYGDIDPEVLKERQRLKKEVT